MKKQRMLCWIIAGVFLLYPFLSTCSAKEEESLFVAKKAFNDGFYQVSQELLERFLKNYPLSDKKPDVQLLIGECYFYQNKYLDALSIFEDLSKDPAAKNIQDSAYYWIAEVHFRGNDFEKAAAYYKKIIEGFPKSSYTAACYYSLGWCAFQMRSFQDAMTYFQAVETNYPREAFSQDASFKVIECLYNLKDYEKLKERLKPYFKLYAKDANKLQYLYFYLAEAQYYLNNFQDAQDGYAKVITVASDNKLKALSQLGNAWAFLKLKRYKQAEDMFAAVKTDDLEKSSRDVLLLGTAILLSQTERFKEADDVYTSLERQTSDPLVLIQAYLGKADSLYNMGKYQESVALYQEALGKPLNSVPQDIIDKLHYGLAWGFLKAGEFKKAIEEFQKVVQQSEDKIVKVAALCQIGDTYQDSGDYAKAVETYDSILKDYPDSFYSDYVQYQLGFALLKNSNYHGAILAFQTLKVNYPNSTLLDDATYALGLAYFQREDYISSKEIFEKFLDEIKESPLRPQVMYLLGTSYYNQGKYQEAIEVFKNVTRLFSQDVELSQKAEYEIADCYYQMGDEKEAMTRFNMLRSKYPDSSLTPEVMWWLGEYYFRHKDFILSRRYFSSLIKDFPKSTLIASSYYTLGSIAEEESKFDEALENFNKVIELGKSDLSGTAVIAVADINARQEKYEQALATYNSALKEYPQLAQVVYPKIAETYRVMNNFDDAINFYRKSLDIVPVEQMSAIQFKIAEVRQAQGAVQDAIEEYLKVTYLYSADTSLVVKSLLRVAALYEEKEKLHEAMDIYKKVITMNVPESKYAQERVDALGRGRE